MSTQELISHKKRPSQAAATPEPTLKGMFSFLVFQRGLIPLVTITWGLMLGGAALLTLTALGIARLGGGFQAALVSSVLLGGLSVAFAVPVTRNAYRTSKARTAPAVGKLFLVSILYGLAAPFLPLYRIARVAFLKYRLDRNVRWLNRNALRMQGQAQELHKRVMETRRKTQEAAKTRPRGHSGAAVLNLETEKLRLNVRTIGEEVDQHLLECRRLAMELGISLRETETEVCIPSDATVLRLFSLQFRAASIRA